MSMIYEMVWTEYENYTSLRTITTGRTEVKCYKCDVQKGPACTAYSLGIAPWFLVHEFYKVESVGYLTSYCADSFGFLCP